MDELYDEDYFERGIETGKSCYQNYRWMPEATMSMAMTMIDLLGIKKDDTILDYGCALGYLVKAFRLLHRNAWGVDVSEYAIRNIDPAVKPYCSRWPFPTHPQLIFDFGIAKDVFEHIYPEELFILLRTTLSVRKLFVVVPLGENGKYFATPNDFDVTHINCEDFYWWEKQFQLGGWSVLWFGNQIDGIKDSYYEKYPEGHGFYILEKDGENE